MLGRFLYLEFLFPILDYLKTLELREGTYDLGIPVYVTLILYFNLAPITADQKSIIGSAIALLAILIGFSITSITVLSTSSGEAIKLLKEKKSKRMISKKPISLFQLLHIGFTYALIIEILTLASILTFSVLLRCNVSSPLCSGLYFFNIFLLIHIILINLRNTTNFYFVLFKSE